MKIICANVSIMIALRFLKLFYKVESIDQLLSLFYPSEYKEPLYNPLYHIHCLR